MIQTDFLTLVKGKSKFYGHCHPQEYFVKTWQPLSERKEDDQIGFKKKWIGGT